MKQQKRSPLLIVLFTIFLDMLGIGILIPVLPALLANPSSPYFLLPSGWTVDQGFFLLGLLTASYPFAQFLAAPILGQLSDRFGRKPVLAISLLGTCISYIVFALGILWRNIPLLFLSRAFDGLTGGNIAVAQAAIADITKPQDRAKTFGLVGAVFGIGFIIGPFLGGVLSSSTVVGWFNAATPFLFAAILSAINVVSVIVRFPETHKHVDRDKHVHLGRALHNIGRAFRMSDLRLIFVTLFIYTSGFGFFSTFFSVFLISRFGFAEAQIGNFFAYVGLWIVFTQGVITRQVSGKFKEYQVLRLTLFATGLVMLTYFLPTQSWQLLLVTPFFAIANGLSMANVSGLVSRSADAKIQGEILGIMSSVQALAQSLPPILSGLIAASLGPSVPVLFASGLIMLAGLIFAFAYKPTHYKHPVHQDQPSMHA